MELYEFSHIVYGMDAKDTKRDVIIDLIRGIGIVLMVTCHAGGPAKNFIYLFHMSIFFIASGYCYKVKDNQKIIDVLKHIGKKIIRLWLPYAGWSILFTLLHNFFLKINVYTSDPTIYQYVQGPFIVTMGKLNFAMMKYTIIRACLLHAGTQLTGAFWFLATLFEIEVTYFVIDYIIRKIFRNKILPVILIQGIISALFLCVGYMCARKNIYAYQLDFALSYYCLFYLGYVIKTYAVFSREQKRSTRAIIGIVALGVLVVGYLIGIRINLGSRVYVNPGVLLVMSAAGWTMLYEFAWFIKDFAANKVLVIIAQHSLAIVAFHFLSFKIVSLIGVLIKHQPKCLIAAFPVLYKGGLWWVAYLVVGITIPVLLGMGYNRVKKAIIKKVRHAA